MTDRELLEFAAKAAGYKVDFNNEQWDKFWVMDTGFWNPLTNDGDALRLAVKLDIELYQGDDDGAAIFTGYWGKSKRSYMTKLFCVQPADSDPYAATRRAITRAAAEIGKGKE